MLHSYNRNNYIFRMFFIFMQQKQIKTKHISQHIISLDVMVKNKKLFFVHIYVGYRISHLFVCSSLCFNEMVICYYETVGNMEYFSQE